MTDKVTDIGTKRGQTTLCLCVRCKHHFVGQIGMRDTPPNCPECDSAKTVIDQLWEIPLDHRVYTCDCGNKLYKLCLREDDSVYWLCVACGAKSER